LAALAWTEKETTTVTDGKEPGTLVKKRKMMDCETQTTPKKIGHAFDIEVDMTDSPETKKLKGRMIDIARMIEIRKEEKLRKKLGL
jgi:hypothetical protein